MSNTIAVIAVPLFFLIMGIWFFSAGTLFVVCGRISIQWPTTVATIRESRLRGGTVWSGNVYWSSVEYEYQVNSRTFTGKRIAFGKRGTKWNNTLKKEVAQKLLDKYKVGQTVPVHYMPAWKKMSVIEPGFSWSSVVILLVGALWLFMGVILLNT